MDIAVITGAANGIGKALAREAVRRGMHVAIADRDASGLSALAQELGKAVALSRALDVADAKALADFSAEVAAKGPITLVFANAGIFRMGSLLNPSLGEWNAVIDVNLKGTLNTIAAFVPKMNAAGTPSRIIITGSEACFDSSPDIAIYCATKHALWAIADGLHHDLARAGVTHVSVSLLIPGIIATAIARPKDAAGDPLLREMDEILNSVGADPADMAGVAFEGVDAKKFYIFFRPEVVDTTIDRAKSVKAGAPRPPRMGDMSAIREG